MSQSPRIQQLTFAIETAQPRFPVTRTSRPRQRSVATEQTRTWLRHTSADGSGKSLPHRSSGPTVSGIDWSRPAAAIGDFVVLAGETFSVAVPPTFAVRELIDQIWFVATGVDRPDTGAVDSLHRPHRLHAEHRADRGGCRRPVRCRCRAGVGHPGRTGRHGDRGIRRRRHRDLRGSGCPDDPRGDRRDEGHRHQPDPSSRGAARDRCDFRCAAAVFGGRGGRASRAATSSWCTSSTSPRVPSSSG